MPRKRAITKFDKARQREDAKKLVFAGYTHQESADLVEVPVGTVSRWAMEDGWTQEINRIQAIANKGIRERPEEKRSLANRIAFDRVNFGKTTHRILAKGARKAAKTWLNQPGEVFVEHAGGFKAIVEATSKLHPESFGEEQGNKFAINIAVGKVLESSDCRELTAEEASLYIED